MINIYCYSVIELILIIFGAAPAKIQVRYFVNLKALRQTIETAPDTTFKARKPTRFVTLNQRDLLLLTSRLGHTARPS